MEMRLDHECGGSNVVVTRESKKNDPIGFIHYCFYLTWLRPPKWHVWGVPGSLFHDYRSPTVSTFIVKYLETEAGSRNNSESGIPVSRLTVTPFTFSDDGPKRRPRNEVETPDGDSATAEHPTKSIKTRLQEGFANGWAKGWQRHDFSKRTMSRAEITEKMVPDCLWLRGYLEG